MPESHKHVWSKSDSGLTRICDALGCGEVQSLVQDNVFDPVPNPYLTAGLPTAHVLCGVCRGNAYLCGTLRTEAGETEVRSMDVDKSDEELCVVCFADDAPVCNTCGSHLVVTR